VFREAYLEYNYPYKVFSRAALKDFSLPAETVATVQGITFASVPVYWRDSFHGGDDDRNTGWLIINLAFDVMTIIDIVNLGYRAGVMLIARIAERAAAREALALRNFAAQSVDEHFL
jgi:hypothetical protein